MFYSSHFKRRLDLPCFKEGEFCADILVSEHLCGEAEGGLQLKTHLFLASPLPSPPKPPPAQGLPPRQHLYQNAHLSSACRQQTHNFRLNWYLQRGESLETPPMHQWGPGTWKNVGYPHRASLPMTTVPRVLNQSHSSRDQRRDSTESVTLPTRQEMQDIALPFFFFKIFFFLAWTSFKVFFNSLQYCLFYVLVFWLRGIWGLSSWTRDQTCTLCIGRQSLNHWTAREVPDLLLKRDDLLTVCLSTHVTLLDPLPAGLF